MEREIKRNDFGQIVSYEITSSNEEYGKVYLESNVIKFDEDSYYEQYPLELNNFELPFKPVLVVFDITQNSFPFYEFTYKTASSVLPNGSFPVWEMKGLSVSNVGSNTLNNPLIPGLLVYNAIATSHEVACDRWADEESYYTINPIWDVQVGDYIYKDPQGLTALVFMDNDKRMAFMAAGVKRSFKLEKGTGKILDIHRCAGSGGPRPNGPLLYYMRGSDEGNNYRSISDGRACDEWRDEYNFWTQKIIYELTVGDYIYKYENDSISAAAASGPRDNFSDGHPGAQTVILGTGTNYWKAFSAGGYKIAFKLSKDTGRIMEIKYCPNSNLPPIPSSVSQNLYGPQFPNANGVGNCNSIGTYIYYTQNKQIGQLTIGDKIYDLNGLPIRDPNDTKWIAFNGIGVNNGVKRRFKIDKLDGKILDIDVCSNSLGIPMASQLGITISGITIPGSNITTPAITYNTGSSMFEMIGGNPNATTEWDAETGGAACRRWRRFHTYYTHKPIGRLAVGDFIYKNNMDIDASNTFIPNNFNTKWFAFQAVGIKRAFKIERGIGKIIDTHNC